MAQYKVRCREWVEWDEVVEADTLDEAETAACERVRASGHRVEIHDVYEIVKVERVSESSAEAAYQSHQCPMRDEQCDPGCPATADLQHSCAHGPDCGETDMSND